MIQNDIKTLILNNTACSINCNNYETYKSFKKLMLI